MNKNLSALKAIADQLRNISQQRSRIQHQFMMMMCISYRAWGEVGERGKKPQPFFSWKHKRCIIQWCSRETYWSGTSSSPSSPGQIFQHFFNWAEVLAFFFISKKIMLCYSPLEYQPRGQGRKTLCKKLPKLTRLQFRYFLYFASLKANYWNINNKKLGRSTFVLFSCVVRITRFMKSRMLITTWP